MKIVIIGCGNMGGAIARGLASCEDLQIAVTSHDGQTAQALAKDCPSVQAFSNNREGAQWADVVIVAVKPWLVRVVLDEMESSLKNKTVLSVAAGMVDPRIQVYVMPNIAARYGESMTFIQETPEGDALQVAVDLFDRLGQTLVVEPRQMIPGMMLAGCGIAYVMRFVRAMQQAGVELGFRPQLAQDIALQTMEGAAAVLKQTGLHPEQAIDMVTTPGGYTIRGLNELDHAGFTSAVIRAMKTGLNDK